MYETFRGTASRPREIGELNHPNQFYYLLNDAAILFSKQTEIITPELLRQRTGEIRSMLSTSSLVKPDSVEYLTGLIAGSFSLETGLPHEDMALQSAMIQSALFHLGMYGAEETTPELQTETIYNILRGESMVQQALYAGEYRQSQESVTHRAQYGGILNMLKFTRTIIESDAYDMFFPDYRNPYEMEIDTRHDIDTILVRDDGTILLLDITSDPEIDTCVRDLRRVNITSATDHIVTQAVKEVIRTVYQLSPTEEIDFSKYSIGAATIYMPKVDRRPPLPHHYPPAGTTLERREYLHALGNLTPDLQAEITNLIEGIDPEKEGLSPQEYISI